MLFISFRFACFNLGVNPSNPLVADRQRKAYICYSLFCWGIPFVAVGTCLALHLTKTGNVVYGELGFPGLQVANSEVQKGTGTYNYRQIVLEMLLNKATESGSQIETSAHLLLWYVKAFVCRLAFPPAPCSLLEFSHFIYA